MSTFSRSSSLTSIPLSSAYLLGIALSARLAKSSYLALMKCSCCSVVEFLLQLLQVTLNQASMVSQELSE